MFDIFQVFNMTQMFEILLAATILAVIFPITTNGEKFMSKVDFKQFRKGYGIDQAKRTDGVWKDLSMIPGAKVKVAKADNPNAERLVRSLYKPYAKVFRQKKELDPGIQDKIQVQILSQAILKDWDGIPGVDGNPVPYSIEEAEALLSDAEFGKEFRDEIQEFADDFSSFQVEEDKELGEI